MIYYLQPVSKQIQINNNINNEFIRVYKMDIWLLNNKSNFLPIGRAEGFIIINKANIPTKWTACLPNPAINHHLGGIIIINLTSSARVASRDESATVRRADHATYIMWRLHVSNKHYGGLAFSRTRERVRFYQYRYHHFRSQNWFTIRLICAQIQCFYTSVTLWRINKQSLFLLDD